MAAEVSADWSTNSNEAIIISLVAPAPGGSKVLSSFNPQYSHALFGEEESIFGYKNLKINLRFNASDMRPNVQISYEKKFKAVADTEAQDPIPVLKEFLPQVAFEKSSTFETSINSEDLYKDWTPPGALHKRFDEGDSKFEVWKSDLAAPDAQQFFKRIQVLVPFFIDGGVLLDLEEATAKRWSLFLLFQVEKDAHGMISPYVLMGCATTYRYYIIVDVNSNRPKTEPKMVEYSLPLKPPKGFRHRARISQFIILPPFQGKGHGSRLYNLICTHYRNIKACREITVEDPNESFDDLRDYNDLIYLRTQPEFCSISINPQVKISNKKAGFDFLQVFGKHGVEKGKFMEDLRCYAKIAPRQFWRVLEMQLLSQIPPHIRQSRIFVAERTKDAEEEKLVKKKYRLWQLLVKTRLHRHNKEILMQLPRAERADRLEATANSVEVGYAKTLLALEKKSKGEQAAEDEEAADQDEEEEGEEGEKSNAAEKRAAEAGTLEGEPKAKKAKNVDTPSSTNQEITLKDYLDMQG